jgi:hypothetical protein
MRYRLQITVWASMRPELEELEVRASFHKVRELPSPATGPGLLSLMGSESDERGTDIKLWGRRIITHAAFPQMGALVARIGRIAVSWHRGSVAARAARSKAAAIMQATNVGTNSPAESPLVRRFRGPTGTNHNTPYGSSGGKSGLGCG